MPMTPPQYARTVPHHTVYGGLYIRDGHDRPIRLRSVYGCRLWQFPGGMWAVHDLAARQELMAPRRRGFSARNGPAAASGRRTVTGRGCFADAQVIEFVKPLTILWGVDYVDGCPHRGGPHNGGPAVRRGRRGGVVSPLTAARSTASICKGPPGSS